MLNDIHYPCWLSVKNGISTNTSNDSHITTIIAQINYMEFYNLQCFLWHFSFFQW